MKRILFVLAGVMLLASAAQAATVTGTTVAFPITVTIGNPVWLTGTVDPAVLTFGTVAATKNAFSNAAQGNPRATVQNISVGNVDLTALAAVTTGTMTLGSTLAGTGLNIGVLAGIFTFWADHTTDPVNGIDMVAGKFANDDVLPPLTTIRAQTTTPNVLRDPLDAITIGGQNTPGYNVPVGESRTMRFMFEAPSSVDVTVLSIPQTITVTIGGVAL